jgi:hypothetical protein
MIVIHRSNLKAPGSVIQEKIGFIEIGVVERWNNGVVCFIEEASDRKAGLA